MLVTFFLLTAGVSGVDVSYSREVKPILEQHCVECHHDGARQPYLNNFPFSAAAEDPSQEAIVQKMLLYVQPQSGQAPRMPPGARPKLNPTEIEVLNEWLSQGLKP